MKYKDGGFNPTAVFMGRGEYLSIINDSEDDLMWLISDNKLYQTPRGYGKSEEALARLDEPIKFEIKDKLNPENVVTVVVK